MENSTYQVIARRWRPKSFEELVGQEHIVRTLTNAIDQSRIAHAYLFVGPRGTGKTSTARLFAMALNCEEGPSINFDINSPICQSILKGSSMDVIEIDGASNNSVDQIRELREDCIYAPTQCRYKIYIIDEVHMLSTAAFNALLKTLEEPPAHVKFFFATTEAHKVLPTIVSRCQRFEFRPISPKVIADKLGAIAKSEGIEITHEVLMTIGRLASGGMRDAQSILDQIISFCGKKIVEQDVLDVYGLASNATIKELTQALACANYPTIIKVSNELVEQGRDLYRVLIDIQTVVHDALVDAINQNGQSSLLGRNIVLSTENLMRMLEVLQAGEKSLRSGLSEKVNFEITLLKAIEQSRSRGIDSLIKEITQLSNQLPAEVGKKKIASAPEPIPLPEVVEELYDEIPEIPTFKEADNSEIIPQESPNSEIPLDNALAKLPESTKKLLYDLFRANIKGVQALKFGDWN